MSGSEYINEERRGYSLYVLHNRAIPYAADGLKAAARRILWTARDGKMYKTAVLAGATMPIHPHASPETATCTLAAPYGNNIPLLAKKGAMGTLLKPTAYSATRYTSVKISDFTKDVVFKDIEIIPMVPNYDDTLMEPKHFLPLVPIVLLNPQEGIAVGFASDILPRSLEDIIISQMCHLTRKTVTEIPPCFNPTSQQAVGKDEKTGRWVFRGECERVNATTLRITNLPYGIVHEKYVAFLETLIENKTILDVVDRSKNEYNIEVRFKKGELRKIDDAKIIKLFKLEKAASENLNVIDFTGEQVWNASYVEIIEKFTDWRLQFYKQRYERLADLLKVDIQKYLDILLAIKKNLGSVAKKIQSRSELKDFCQQIGIVHLDYIADLSVYRFTEQEKQKTEKKLADARKLLAKYERLIASERERKKVYIKELEEVLAKYG